MKRKLFSKQNSSILKELKATEKTHGKKQNNKKKPVQKISSEDDGVLRRVYGVDPSWRDKEGVAGRQLDPETMFDNISEKYFALKNN